GGGGGVGGGGGGGEGGGGAWGGGGGGGEGRGVSGGVTGQAPPAAPPPLGEVVRHIASLGGYLGRKGDGPPGPKAMWLGMQRMTDLARGWHAFASIGPRPTG